MADITRLAASFNAEQKRLFLVRAERLVRLLQLNAPKEIIGGEVMMLVKSGISVYGQDFFFKALGADIHRWLNLELGICDLCIGKENPNLATEDGLCDSCRQSLLKEDFDW